MTLKELIERLEAADYDMVVPKGFNNPHSYRGYYDELAFEPAENITVGEMLACAIEANGSTYTGWKGGEFTMGDYTNVHIAHMGECGDEVSQRLLDYMLDFGKVNVTDNKEILSCPFCGDDAHSQHIDYRGDHQCNEYEIICNNQDCQDCQCDWVGEDGESLESVISSWNTRTYPPEITAVLDAAKADSEKLEEEFGLEVAKLCRLWQTVRAAKEKGVM